MTKFIAITKNVRGKGEARVIPVLVALRTKIMKCHTGMVAHQEVRAYILYLLHMHTLGTIVILCD